MEFYVANYFSSPTDAIEIATALEQGGIDGMSVADHIFFPAELRSPYPYTPDGALPFPADTTPWPDVWVTIAALGSLTTSLKFLTHVYVLAARSPLLVAKAAGTAASLCQGRLSMGVGVGWMREEYEALGAPFEHRGRVTDECISIVRRLWSEGKLDKLDTDFFHLPALVMNPRPPPIPILIGGESERALDRAARLGDGFVGLPHDAPSFGEVIKDMHRRLRGYGRDPAKFHINARALPGSPLQEYLALAELGSSSVHVSLWAADETSLERKLTTIGRFVDDVVRPFHDRLA